MAACRRVWSKAPDSYYESEGRTFESFRARHFTACAVAATFPPTSPIQMSKSLERRSTSHSRDTNPPEFFLLASPSPKRRGAGNAGCRPHPWPACNKKSGRQSPQARPEHPAFPARWFYGLYVRSPESGLVSLRRLVNRRHKA